MVIYNQKTLKGENYSFKFSYNLLIFKQLFYKPFPHVLEVLVLCVTYVRGKLRMYFRKRYWNLLEFNLVMSHLDEKTYEVIK